MRVAHPIVLDETTRKELQRLARRRSVPVRVALRSRIVLLAADGLQNCQISAELRISVRMAALWRKRFLSLAIQGLLKDAPRPGRTPSIPASTVERVVRKTTRTIPDACHALVNAHYGARGGHLGSQRAAHLARAWAQTASRGEFQNQP